mmetsp:Transcript_103811/g.289146  ORF Transcript_103811/g.289146 Transcript_103811/m.289146 type:complete len:88 (+) Transcript_103811:265-528(+)
METTRIRSESAIALSLCATTNCVFPSLQALRLSRITFSEKESRALVASSRTRIGGLRRSERATATLWRWPPLSVESRTGSVQATLAS